jgi:tRNA pseudouridine38-40 synthase
MPTYRLAVEYEGTRYHGWQEQPNARTVAGELRRAVEEAGAAVVDLGGAGRTDAGVHALEQTAHLRLERPVEARAFRRAVNDALPADVHVSALAAAAPTFHARHDALARSYLYQIATRRTAFGKRYVWWVKRPLDAGAIARAAALLPGRHDFALLCERPREAASTEVVVEHAEVGAFDELLVIRIVASHFLWRMVRRVIGALVHVGGGELREAAFDGLLEARLPAPGVNPAAWTAPPSGLFLERVLYPDTPPLAALRPAVAIRAEPELPGAESAARPARFRGRGRRGNRTESRR